MRAEEKTAEKLRELGFTVLDSQTNFLFVTHKEHNAKSIFEYLKTRRVYVRYFNQPKIDNYLRITVGTENEMDIFLREIKRYITEVKNE